MKTTSSRSNVFIRWQHTHTQVRRPGNPHTSVRGANTPYDSAQRQSILKFSLLTASHRAQRVTTRKQIDECVMSSPRRSWLRQIQKEKGKAEQKSNQHLRDQDEPRQLQRQGRGGLNKKPASRHALNRVSFSRITSQSSCIDNFKVAYPRRATRSWTWTSHLTSVQQACVWCQVFGRLKCGVTWREHVSAWESVADTLHLIASSNGDRTDVFRRRLHRLQRVFDLLELDWLAGLCLVWHADVLS